jgi:hypothetical protein
VTTSARLVDERQRRPRRELRVRLVDDEQPRHRVEHGADVRLRLHEAGRVVRRAEEGHHSACATDRVDRARRRRG